MRVSWRQRVSGLEYIGFTSVSSFQGFCQVAAVYGYCKEDYALHAGQESFKLRVNAVGPKIQCSRLENLSRLGCPTHE